MLVGAAITVGMDRLLFGEGSRVGDLRGLHLAWSVAVTLAATAAAFLIWPRREASGLSPNALPEEQLLTVQRRLLAHAFARSMAHDGNNILLGLRFRIAELARLEQGNVHSEGGHGRPEEAAELVHEMGQTCDDLEVLIGRLRELGQQNDRLVVSSLDLEAFLPRVLDFASGHADVRVCRPSVDVEPGLGARADSLLLRQLLTNLLINAAQSGGSDRKVELRARSGLEHALIEVHDNGPGIPAAERDEAGQFLQTDRPDGSGLGLWAARRAASLLGGSLSLTDSDLGGLCVRITLPRAEEAPFEEQPVRRYRSSSRQSSAEA